MAKSTKHTEAVKSYEEFRAPWETADGSEAEIDRPRLKRYLYNLTVDKAKAQDAREDAVTELTEAQASLEKAEADLETASGPEAQKKIDKLQKKVDDLTEAAEKRQADDDLADLRAEVLEGVDPKYAKRVTGTTREELEESYADLAKDFDLPALGEEAEPGDDDGDDDVPTVRTRPRTLHNAGDPAPGKGAEKEIDFDAAANEILGVSVFG